MPRKKGEKARKVSKKTSKTKRKTSKTRKSFNPKTLIRKREPGKIFRIKNRENQPNTFAGFATFRVTSKRQALRLLNHYADLLGFWQMRKEWKVKLPGSKRSSRAMGYSKAQQPKDAAGGKWTLIHLNRAENDTAISAANRKGASRDYESKQPEWVKPASRGFDLLIWFGAERKRTLSSLVGRSA